MRFVEPSTEQLAKLRADPLLWEQELDARPEVAESLERALGFRAGRAYWQSAQSHLYAIELADLGRGRPSMAIVYGFWERWEPRPAERIIDLDLIELCQWIAEVCDGLEPEHLSRVLERTPAAR